MYDMICTARSCGSVNAENMANKSRIKNSSNEETGNGRCVALPNLCANALSLTIDAVEFTTNVAINFVTAGSTVLIYANITTDTFDVTYVSRYTAKTHWNSTDDHIGVE